MAGILIRQFAGQSVPPTSDAILYENATTGSGVVHGCACTISDASTVHIAAGFGIIQGRLFEIEDQDIAVTLSPSGTLKGQIWVHLDLSDSDNPIDIYEETAASLTPMTQQSDINYSNGVYEIQLCTFDVDTSTISNIQNTFPTLQTTGAAISALNSRINANKYSSAVDLTPYTSSNRYIFPTDGYLFVSSEARESGIIQVPVTASDDGMIAGIYMNITGTYQIDSLYVKKGMKCFIQDRSDGTVVRFHSLAE